MYVETYLSFVVWTHVQVAQYGFLSHFLIKFLICGPIISWPRIQLQDQLNKLCWRVKENKATPTS